MESLVLKSSRLYLHPIRPSDSQAIQKSAGKREIADTMISIPYPYPPGEAERYVHRKRIEQKKSLSVTFVIREKLESHFCGVVEIREIDREHYQAELSFWLDLKVWGRGYMSESIHSVLRYAFEDLGLNRLYAYHMVRNPATGRVLEKNGFSREGILRQRVMKWGKFEDVALWAILSQDWFELPFSLSGK